MDTVKTVIYAACVIGVVSTMIEIASPDGSMKKQLDTVIGIILVMVIVTPFIGSDFKIRLSDSSLTADSKVYGDIKSYENSALLNEAEQKVSDYFRSKLSGSGIKCKDIVIKAELNEYNQIEIKSVTVTAPDNHDRIREIIVSELQKAEINIIAGDKD